jgi:hypothetical protein
MAICVLCDENELKPHSKLTTCTNCRASMGTWQRRTQAEILNRRRKLHIYDLRMENVILHPGNIRAQPVIKPFVSANQVKKQARELRRNGR